MPYKNPEVQRAYRKRYNKQNAAKRADQHRVLRHKLAKPFVGVDGEGGNINGRHEYLLLRAGNRVLETGKPLSTRECLDFLCSLEDNQEYVSYFFTYDVTMILRDLPLQIISKLLDRASRTPLDKAVPQRVQWGYYRMDWMPGKEFRIGKYSKDKPFKWTVISDVGSFFQSSFVEALTQWNIGSDALRKRIAASKEKRSGFTEITKLTRLYNKKECDLLTELMNEFRDVCGSVGPHPYHWQGPGNLASAWLRHHDVPSDQNVPYETMSMARDAYYGGRFEITAVGSIRRKIYQYDINSAYPAVIRSLPCLVHGAWKHTVSKKPRRTIYVSRVNFENKTGTFLGTLPIRSKEGNISYPRTGSGTYWSVELEAAQRTGCKIEFLESWEYMPDCKCRALSWIDEVYQLRRQVGKSNKGKALKLALNSIYGKFAQSIGHPRWANPIWAGLITATTRSKIIDACRQVNGSNILMIATDGIFSDKPLDLPLNNELGGWERTIHDWMFIIQPGLYLLPIIKPKTRGVPRVKIIEHARVIRKSWHNPDVQMQHKIPLNRFLAARQAVHQNAWTQAGTWYTENRAVSFDWHTKRDEHGYWDVRQYAEDRPAFRPEIQEGGVESIPYGKSIGMWERARLFDEDQPEEADVLS